MATTTTTTTTLSPRRLNPTLNWINCMLRVCMRHLNHLALGRSLRNNEKYSHFRLELNATRSRGHQHPEIVQFVSSRAVLIERAIYTACVPINCMQCRVVSKKAICESCCRSLLRARARSRARVLAGPYE